MDKAATTLAFVVSIICLTFADDSGTESPKYIKGLIIKDDQLCPTSVPFYNSSYAKDCERLTAPEAGSNVSITNFHNYMCLEVYDLSFGICQVASLNPKMPPPNVDTEMRAIESTFGDANSFCHKFAESLYSPLYDKTKEDAIKLNSKIKNVKFCQTMCFNWELKVYPLCTALYWGNQFVRKAYEDLEKDQQGALDKSGILNVRQEVKQQPAASKIVSRNGTDSQSSSVVDSKKADDVKVTDINSSPVVAIVNETNGSGQGKTNNNERSSTDSLGEATVYHSQSSTNGDKKENKAVRDELPKNDADTKEIIPDLRLPSNQGGDGSKESVSNYAANAVKPSVAPMANNVMEITASSVTKIHSSSTNGGDTSKLGEETNENEAGVVSENTADTDKILIDDEQDRKPGEYHEDGNDSQNQEPVPPVSGDIEDVDHDFSPGPRDNVAQLYNKGEMDEAESHFFVYFMVASLLCVGGYVGYHNKQKILAIVLEGRRSKGGRNRRRPNTAGYRKLDCTLEEAVTSQCNSNVTHVIY